MLCDVPGRVIGGSLCWVGWCLAAGPLGSAGLGTRVLPGVLSCSCWIHVPAWMWCCLYWHAAQRAHAQCSVCLPRLWVALPLQGGVCCGLLWCDPCAAVCFCSVPWRAAAWDACCQLAGGTAQASSHIVLPGLSSGWLLLDHPYNPCRYALSRPHQVLTAVRLHSSSSGCLLVSCMAGRGVSPQAFASMLNVAYMTTKVCYCVWPGANLHHVFFYRPQAAL